MFITLTKLHMMTGDTQRCAVDTTDIASITEATMSGSRIFTIIKFKYGMESINVTEKYDDVLRVVNGDKPRDQIIEEAVRAGWEACRTSLYAVCEDLQDKAEAGMAGAKLPDGYVLTTADDFNRNAAYHFHRGELNAGKSIARGFNSMEALDDNNVRELLKDD